MVSPHSAIMTDESLSETLSRGGQGGRREQEEATGESSWVSGQLSSGRLPAIYIRLREGQRQTERDTGD